MIQACSTGLLSPTVQIFPSSNASFFSNHIISDKIPIPSGVKRYFIPLHLGIHYEY
jgi:hypothetical protein